MGVRYNFRTHLSYDLVRIGAGYRYVTSGWQFNCNTIFERIVPGGEARTWRPEFLVFGVQNLNVNRLSTDSRDGIYIGLYFSKSFGKLFQLAYEIQQYVPLDDTNSAGSPDKPDIKSSHDIEKKSIYGGGKHKIYIILTL